MATDYDAPRKQDEEQNEESYEELNARRSEMQSGAVDEDENSAAESFELPGADLSNEELNVVVLPAQDESSPAPPASWYATARRLHTKRATCPTASSARAKTLGKG